MFVGREGLRATEVALGFFNLLGTSRSYASPKLA